LLCSCIGKLLQHAEAGGENNDGAEVQTEDQYASYPEKPLTLIVPYAAGGESDNISRPIAQYMKK
jgi:hypothetical protein